MSKKKKYFQHFSKIFHQHISPNCNIQFKNNIIFNMLGQSNFSKRVVWARLYPPSSAPTSPIKGEMMSP